MDKTCVLALILFFAALVPTVNAQKQQGPVDRYLETGKTIVIAKCLEVGPVNILLKAHVRVEILLVVKGKETLREITIVSQYGMEEGERYLLRTENEGLADRSYFEVETRDSVIPVSRHEEIEKLKNLSPRIIILRTMNLRVDALESEIRRLTYELDALRTARKEN